MCIRDSYVPFTYVGTVNAYSLKNEADNDTTSYEHSLFIANYNVTHTVSWNDLNTAGLLFGKDYAGAVSYTHLDVYKRQLNIYEQADLSALVLRLAGGSGASGHPCGQGVLGVVRAQGL